MTGYSHVARENFHHPVHLHGHEMFLMATGTGTVNETTSKIEIENANPAFKCESDSVNCHLVERNEEIPIGNI